MLFTDQQLSQLSRQLGTDPTELRSASVQADTEPLQLARAGSALFSHATYFRTPEGDEVASLGIAWRTGAAGRGRFGSIQSDLLSLQSLTAGARLVVGFSFNPEGPSSPEWDDFGAADAVLPIVTLTRSGRRGRLVVALPPGRDSAPLIDLLSRLDGPPDPPPPDPGSHTVESVPSSLDWQAEVAEAVGAIQDGSFEKVVLARSVLVRSERSTDPFDLAHHLVAANPSSYIYTTVVDDSAFVGASPELLLAQQGREIRLNPLAGSARRGKGEDDAAVGEELLRSRKDQTEHAIVVDDLITRLGELTSRIDRSPEPVLRRMATVQHLSTEMAATLLDDVGTFDVLASIHPTPAVGGTPRSEALAFIDKVEGIDRGWYAGGVGWIDPMGEAQIALALRCALISGTTSRLYAGNGIVADSEPAAELIETRLKFQPMLDLLAVT